MKTKYVKLFEEYKNKFKFKTYTTKEEIISWLDKCGVHEYTLRLEDDGYFVDVSWDVHLKNMSTHIPVRFGNVDGSFYCKSLGLVTLHNSPITVGFDFDCSDNKLVTLEYLPKIIPNQLLVNSNYLISNTFENKINPKYGILGLTTITTIYNRIEYYKYYLENNSPDVQYSLSWLQRVDNELYDQIISDLIEYSIKNNTDWFSDRVVGVNKNISTRQNKRMPLL